MVPSPTARPFLATLPEYPSLGESIAFQLNGLIVVFVALGAIWALLELTGVFFKRRQPAPKKSVSAPAPASAPPAPAPPDTLTPAIAAVIAAAVATVLKSPHRIQSINAENPARDWAHEGRREIFGSHRIR